MSCDVAPKCLKYDAASLKTCYVVLDDGPLSRALVMSLCPCSVLSLCLCVVFSVLLLCYVLNKKTNKRLGILSSFDKESRQICLCNIFVRQ